MNTLSIITKGKLLFIFLPVLIGIQSCKLTKSNQTSEQDNEMKVNILCYLNRMPMSDNSSYVVVEIQPTDSIFKENIRLIELSASSENGTWKAEGFDNNEFYGKGLNQYLNTSRNFLYIIGSSYDFKLKIESESGKISSFEIKDVPLTVVQ